MQGIFEVVFPIIEATVFVAWEQIKFWVKTGMDLVLGFIDVGMKLLQGDWEGAWNSIKSIAENIWNNIETYFRNIDLYEIGRNILQGLISGFSSMASAVWGKVGEIASGITDR